MTTKEQFKVFDNYTDLSAGTWKIGSLDLVNFNDLINALGQPSVIGSGDDKIQYEWIIDYKGRTFTIYDWKTYDAEYTENELYVWSIGGNERSASKLNEFKTEIYAKINGNRD